MTGMIRQGTMIVRLMVILALVLTGVAASGAETRTARPQPKNGPPAGKTVVYFFWGNGCPHCAQEETFLGALKKKYPMLEVREFEVWRNSKNADFFHTVMKAAGAKSVGVPATIVGDRLFFGFNSRTATAIESSLLKCIEQGCPETEAVVSGLSGNRMKEEKSISVPLLGELDPAAVSLPLLTVVLGGLDSFNPCAFFVLLFLLSLLIHVRSRGRMLFIGGIFVLFSGIIYFVFMAAWLNIFLIIGQMAAITMTAGIIAVIIASINIKEFFSFKRGISLTIPERAKPKLYERMRGLVRSRSIPALTAGTIALAVMANFYELLCTAGFPMVYTRVLTLHNLTAGQYYLYLAFYNIVYMVPLAVIVTLITITLGSRKLTEWQGKQLKLLSGTMMLFLGILLLVRPALLNNAVAATLLLIVSLAVTWTISTIARKRKPERAGE